MTRVNRETTAFAVQQAFDELRARYLDLPAVLGWLDTLSAKDFEKAATQSITQPRWEGKTMTGADYFLEHALPNFYFHITTAYAILRHVGVDIGKRDYIGSLKLHEDKPKV